MQHRNTIRVAASAIAAIAATVSLTACQSSDDGHASKAPSQAPTIGAPSPTAPSAPAASPAAASPTASSPAASSPSSPAAPVSPASDTSTHAVPTCAATSLEATAYQAAVRPDGTGTGAAVIQFVNVSGKPCVLQGHPTVAGAGNGSPEHNAPLAVTAAGAASTVKLAPGGKAWVKLTFVQVQGEGDGYCVSGAKPASYPTLVVGLPGAGAHQVALTDGVFAECDNKVTATAVSAAKPS
ncbi:DUF4232 domain-containing protein [Streptomyces sp. NPDC002676]